MRRLAAFTTLAFILAAAAPLAAQDKQDSQNKQDSKGGLGGVLDTLGNVLGTGTQKPARHGGRQRGLDVRAAHGRSPDLSRGRRLARSAESQRADPGRDGLGDRAWWSGRRPDADGRHAGSERRRQGVSSGEWHR